MLTGEQIKFLGIVSEYVGELQFQPAGVDVTVKKIFKFVGAGVLDFDNSKRQLPDTKEIELSDESLHLESGVYKILVNEYVKIPRNVVGFCFPRSSLLRAGATVHCAVWDPGYEGRSSFILNVMNPAGISITKNARLAQMVFVEAKKDAEKLYQGVYHKENK